MGYKCMFDDDYETVLLVTNLAEGDTVAVCPQHLGDWAAGFLQAVTGQEWAPTEEAIAHPETGDETDEDEHADSSPADSPAAPDTAAPAAPEGDGDDQGDDVDQGDDDDDAAPVASANDPLLADVAPF